MGTLEWLLRIMNAFAAADPFAVAVSPSGWKRFCSETGPTIIGTKCVSPRIVWLRSISSVGESIRGRSVMRSNMARSPPAMSA